MSNTRTRIPSPARSLPLTPRRRETPRKARSVCSPARSNASGRLTSIIRDHREQAMGSFVLSPLTRKSVLTDNTVIEVPGRQSWWRDLGDNSRDVMEVLQDNNIAEPQNIFDNIVVMSQEEKKQYTLDLHDSSDSDSIHSIVIPQKKLFSEKENRSQKKFNQFGTRETLEKVQKSNATVADKTVSTTTKELFQNEPRSRPVFPAALLDISANTTVSEKTITSVLETKGRAHHLFNNQQQEKKSVHATKRKNMFAKFIESDSEEELPEIQPKFFALQIKRDSRKASLASRGLDTSMASSIDIELEDWQLLPSSTMVEHQLNTSLTAGQKSKRLRLSKLSEAETGTNSSESPKSKQLEKSLNKTKIQEKSSQQNATPGTRNSSKVSLEIGNQKNKSQNESPLKSNTSQSSTVTRGKNKSDVAFSSNKSQNASFNKSHSSNKSKNISKSFIKATDDLRNADRESTSPVAPKNTDNEDDLKEASNYEDDELDFSLKMDEDSGDEIEDAIVMKDKTTNDLSKKDFNYSKNKLQVDINSEQNITTDVINHSAKDKIIEETEKNSTNNCQKQTQFENEKVHENLNKSQKLHDEDHDIEDLHSENHNPEDEYEQDEIENDQEINVNDQNKTKEHQNLSHQLQNESQKTQNETQSDKLPIQKLQKNDENNEQEVIQKEIPGNSGKKENEIQEEVEGKKESNLEEFRNKDKDAPKTSEIQEEVQDVQEISQKELQSRDKEEENEGNDENNDSQEEVQDEQEISQENIQNNEDEEENDSEVENDNNQEEIEDEQEASDQELQNDNENEADQSEIENEESDQIESEEEQNDDEEEQIESEKESDIENNESQEEIEDERNISQKEMEQNESEDNEEMESDDANDSLEVALDSEQDDNQEIDSDQHDLQEHDSDNHDSMETEDDNESVEATEETDHNESPESNQHGNDEEIDNTETPNVSHDTTGRNRKKKSVTPEAILRNTKTDINLTTVHGRNTSIRKTKSIIQHPNLRMSLEPARESIGFSDGSKNSSAEGSGWDSHRTTRKTLRQTFGKDFTPRKSLRALVMEKSAKRRATTVNDTVARPQANSTELAGPDLSGNDYEMCDADDPTPPLEVSIRTRQATLVEYLEKAKLDRAAEKEKVEEAVRRRLEPNRSQPEHVFKVPTRPVSRAPKHKAKKPSPTLIPLEELPEEFIEDLKYKPPKRFAPRNASWLTKRLYKYLETKLEPKYDYKARIRAESLARLLHEFVQATRRARVAAPPSAVLALKTEMARLNIVKTHCDFYNFFHEFMPREVRVKVIPDIVNKIPHPRSGVFSDIL